MPRIGLGQRVGVGRSRGLLRAALNFSALTALPVGRRDAVTAAANAAAATLGVTPQSVVDALAVGRGLASLLPNDGCLLLTSGGATTVQGDPAGAIRSWTGVELATQANASLRPVSAATGLFADGTKNMSAGNLSAWTAGNAFVVSQLDGTSGGTSGFWRIGSNITTNQNDHIPFNQSSVAAAHKKCYTSFGIAADRAESTLLIDPPTKKIIVFARQSGGNLLLRINGTDFINVPGKTPGFSSTAVILESLSTVRFTGTWSAFSMDSTLYTTAQQSAIREFCRNYYEVTY